MRRRIAAYSHATRGIGGSFQYGASLLAALGRLNPEEFEVRLWAYSPDWLAVAARYGIQAVLTQDSPLSARARRSLHIANKFLRNGRLRQWLATPDIVHALSRWHPDVCISLSQAFTPLKNCKVIGPVHDLMHRYEARFPEVGTASIYCDREYLYTNHCATASAILVDSEVGKQHVRELYDPDENKIFVLPFVPSPLAESPRKPECFPFADGQPFLFYPAQMWLHKNHANLLRAVALLPEEMNIRCVFSGTTDKNGFPLYERLVAELGLEKRAHHLGYVADAEALWLYRHARCMVMPSFFGPTNIPPLEAMQYGCPVAVADVYAMRERYGDAALYFNPAEPEEIAAVIERLWTDDSLCDMLRVRGTAQLAKWAERDFEDGFLSILRQVLNY